MKPYSKPRAKQSKAAGWTSNEAKIALAGIIVAAVGVVATAGSTIFTFQQVRVLNRERMTPYRAILYNAKVDSFRDIIVSFNKLERGALPRYKIEVLNHPPPTPTPMNRPALSEVLRNAAFKGELSVWITDVGAAEDALSLTPVWPESIAEKMVHIKNLLHHRRTCLENMKYYPALKRYHAISELTTQCQDANQKSWIFQDERDQLIREMQSELRASQLQEIDSEK